MTNEIIQHHKPFDFNSFYGNIRSCYVGIDYMDFENFMLTEGEKHSFIATAEGYEPICNALNILRAARNDVINKASSLLLTIVRSPESEVPIRVEEIQYVQEFVSEFPDSCDVTWGIAEGPSLGNEINILLLVDLNNSLVSVSWVYHTKPQLIRQER